MGSTSRNMGIIMLLILVMNGVSSGASTYVESTRCMNDFDSEHTIQSDASSSLRISTYDPYEGYTLFSPEYGTLTFLIDNQGDIIHMWESNYIQGLGLELQENGHLLRSCIPGVNSRFVVGGVTGRIEEFDWNNTLVWSFTYSNNSVCLHHDLEVLPNGNILLIAWEYKSKEQILQAGRDPNKQDTQLWPDHIIEVKPIGSSDAEIVWEWHVWDHLVQEYDASKDNYGNVSQHPELIDVNYMTFREIDWNHINSIDYNTELDQILVSSRYFNEIWVIDHSTTTAEAASHKGGRSGKGGDLLYRWGNPQTYHRGIESDHILFAQHSAHWIPQGCPGAGNILIFNNGFRWGTHYLFSSVDEITPPMNQNGYYLISDGSPYGPAERIWSYIADPPTDLYSEIRSSAQRLPNGNTLICEGDSGYFFEVTMEKTTVWEYKNTYPKIDPSIFKVFRYPKNYSGILSRSLYSPYPPMTPNGPTRGQTGFTYSFSTSAIDPNDDKLTYVFDWGDASTKTIGPFSSGYSITASHHWELPGTYVVCVKAIDEDGLESLWSESLLIDIDWTTVFLIGKLDEHTEIQRFNKTIVFFVDSLLYVDIHPFELAWYSNGVSIKVRDEYIGILTSRFCIGRFHVRSFHPFIV